MVAGRQCTKYPLDKGMSSHPISLVSRLSITIDWDPARFHQRGDISLSNPLPCGAQLLMIA